ncbi:MAG: hypothetical protein AB1742_06500 [bacterium]
MGTGDRAAEDAKSSPFLDYVLETYIADASEPGGGERVRLGELHARLEKLKGKRSELIGYLRSLTPFQRHVLDASKELNRIRSLSSEALEKNDRDAATKCWFRTLSLLVSLKLWRRADFAIENMEKRLRFTPPEKAFLDGACGFTRAPDSDAPVPEPLHTTRAAEVDRYELWENDALVDGDYEEPLRVKIREHVEKEYGVRRVDNFSGTKKAFPPNQTLKHVRASEKVHDMTYFSGVSQFLEEKYSRLRDSTYRPLATERHETGGYTERRVRFSLDGDRLVESENGLISAVMHCLSPNTIRKKMINDVKLVEQALTMGAKKVGSDYFFDRFRRAEPEPAFLQRTEGGDGEPPRTPPSAPRERVTAETASRLIAELAGCDRFIFGGHLDFDLYMDGISIRKKPDVLVIEGEGLGCYEYANNLIILPAVCPPETTPLQQVLSALADFRYSLWIDTPKEIFDKQGVGFAVIGRKSKISSSKPLWQIFPTKSSALIKQRAFRTYYVRHVLSFLFHEGVGAVAGCDVPAVNRIAEQKLRQFFDAYVPLSIPAAPPAKPQ